MQKIKKIVVNYHKNSMENRSNIVHIFKNKQIYRESVNMYERKRERKREWMRTRVKEKEKVRN